MTNKTIEARERLRNQANAFKQLERPTMGVAVSLVHELLDRIEELEALQAAQTMPSREEVFAWHEQYYERYNTLPLPIEVYDWLRDNVKAKERHEVSDEEIISMASDECFEIYHDHSSTFSVGYLKGYRAALEKIK